jgi:uncharacterized membrane protein
MQPGKDTPYVEYTMPVRRHRGLHQLFRFTVAIKFFNGIVETIGGIVLLFITHNALNTFMNTLIEWRFNHNPHSLSGYSLNWLFQNTLLHGKTFGALYVIGHGIINLVLALGLWHKKLWAYPISLSIMTSFAAYQIYRVEQSHSLPLALLTILDIVFIVLVWHEYRHIVRHVYPEEATPHMNISDIV